MAALLAAEAGPRHLHPLEDVLVADGRPHELPADAGEGRLEAAVREDGDDEDPAREGVAAQPVEGAQPEELVAVDDAAAAVDDDEPVGVAVEGEAEVGAPGDHLGRERRRGGGPAADVDVHAVRLVVDDVDAGPGRRQDPGGGDAAGAVRAVEDDVEVARRRLGEPAPVVQVAVEERGVVDHAADPGVSRTAELLAPPDELLERVLGRLVELEAAAVEDLEAVVVGRVVRRRDHDPRPRSPAPGEVGEGRRRQDARDRARPPRGWRRPAASAATSIPPERRVSCAERRRSRRARPSRGRSPARGRTRSGARRSTLAIPRMPSVPKRRPIVRAPASRSASPSATATPRAHPSARGPAWRAS